jgi:uncharacterized protein
MGARIKLTAVVLGLALSLAGTAQAAVKQHGYLATRDGTKLRYDVTRPDGPGPFPVLVNYEGYAAGSASDDNGVSTYQQRLLDRGYAIVGVSVRGTGCSEGTFDPFDLTMGRDGADAVEWAARQPWSNGRVGMIGVSFGAITQLLTAAERPPHLVAISPDSATSDLYRDVAYPGGVLEYDFTFAWTGVQKEGGTEYALTGAPRDGDTACDKNYVSHETRNLQPRYFIPTLILNHPFVDDEGGLWNIRAPRAGFPKIDVPVYLFNQWQDEQLPGRIYESLDLFSHPDQVWANFTNGNHARPLYSPTDQNQVLRFYDHFVKGIANGFESTPHLSIDMETAFVRNGKGNEPAWSITRPSFDAGAVPTPLYLHAGRSMGPSLPSAAGGSDSYLYPLPSADVLEPGPSLSTGGPHPDNSTGQFTFKAPQLRGGSVAYTSAPLTHDLVVAGPGSLDLWLSSTSRDTDLQATITEVRPDGQEEYVQRGWLRASHRVLDPAKSTVLRPYPTHRRGDVESLVLNRPTFMRLEIFPFAQAFRRGSRIRVWIDAPTGHTGFWAFASQPYPGRNTILHDRAHPSRLVLGALPGEVAHAPLPACDSIRNQPCRPDPLGLPRP